MGASPPALLANFFDLLDAFEVDQGNITVQRVAGAILVSFEPLGGNAFYGMLAGVIPACFLRPPDGRNVVASFSDRDRLADCLIVTK